MNKGFAPIIIIFALAIVGLVTGGAYYYGKNSSKHTQPFTQQVTLNSSSSPAADETADWKTYTNAKYKFSIKYPEDFKISEYTNEEDQTFTFSITNQQAERERGIDPDKISISVIPGGKDFQRKDFYYGGYEWTKSVVDALSKTPDGTSKEHKYDDITKTNNITTGTFTGVRYKSIPSNRVPHEGIAQLNVALLDNERTFLIAGYTGDDQLIFTKPYTDIFDKVVSTFKFAQ
ncbi:MAG: hypothetical protein WD988_01720 [Candidatus Curtissbacteria bacterium]